MADLAARLATVRVRTTAGAMITVGIALLAGSVVLIALLRGSLAHEMRTAARLQAQEVAARLSAGHPPSLAMTGRDAETAAAGEDAGLVQIIGDDGAVVATSPELSGRPPLASLGDGETTEIALPSGNDRYIVAAAAVSTASNSNGGRTVLVARALDGVTELTRTVAGLLAVGGALLLAVVAAATWRAVGRALAPVEEIRREVDAITGAPQPRSRDEASRLAATMNRMLARIEAAQLRQRRFVSDASQALRSSVARIRQHAEVAVAYPGRTTVGELATTVLADGRQLQRLVEDLLLLSDADERAPSGDQLPVDLADVVFEQAAQLRVRPGVVVDITQVSAGRTRGDPVRLGRMVGHLADNAARHARSRVAFALRKRGGFVELHVDDDGPGIAAEDRQRIFERFVRLENARGRHHGGSGLGLSIVAEIAAGYGGVVSATDSPLGGARFEVRLPLSPE